MEDTEIIALYWARDEKAIEATAARYSRYCKKIALNVIDSEEDAEECVNDTWLSAWEAMPPAKPSILSAFLGKITRNIALNRVRDGSRQKRGGGAAMLPYEELTEFLSDGLSVEEEAESSEIAAAINRFLSGLPKEQRVAFVSHYWYSEPIPEIARKQGASEGKIKMMFLRLRGKLKEALKEEGVLI